MVEIECDAHKYNDEWFERSRDEIITAYRAAMKAGGCGFTLKFADGDYEIQGEDDIHRFINMYKEKKRAKKNEAIDKQYSH